jgi:hypothetical protein
MKNVPKGFHQSNAPQKNRTQMEAGEWVGR